MVDKTVSMSERLAANVLKLEDCAHRTHRAEDRSLYEKYLSDAAGMLATSVAARPIAALRERAKSHERLWGHTWLQDEVYREAAEPGLQLKMNFSAQPPNSRLSTDTCRSALRATFGAARPGR